MAAFGTTLFAKLWDSRISAYLWTDSPIRELVRDESQLIALYGNGIRVPVSNTAPVVTDYMRKNAVTINDVNPTIVNVDLQKERVTAWSVDYADMRETNADYIGRETQKSFVAIRNDMSDYVYTQMKKMIGPNTGGTATDNLATSMQKTLTIKKDGVSGTTFNSAAYRALLVDAIFEAEETCRKEGWFNIGTPYVVVSPAIHRQLNAYLTIDKPNLGVGHLVDEAWSQAGTGRGKLANFMYKVDDRLNASDSTAAAATKIQPIYFGITGEYNTFLQNIMAVEEVARPDRFEVGMKFLWRYGFVPASHMNDKGAYVIHHTVTN